MHFIRFLAAGALVASAGLAQDRVTLTNGDVLTGKIKTMADGKVTVASPLLGDVTVDLAQIENMTTDAAVELKTIGGEIYKRRIVGIEEASLQLEGDIPAIAVDSLDKINPPPAKPPKWTGSANVSALWVDGNTRRRSVGLFGEASRKTEIDRIKVDVHWDYSEDNPQAQTNNGVPQAEWDLTQRRAGGGLQYDYFLSERWYALATTRVLGDTFADIQLRYTVGAGVGYTVIDNDTTTLTTEAGLSYFNENYRSNTPSVDYLAARLAYKLQHQINDRTKLTHGVEAYPSLENKSDIYLQMKTELSTNLTDSMIASLMHVLDYDNTPSSAAFRRDDHRVLLSLGWTF